MVSAAELRRITAFSDLPDNQIDWFLSHAEEMVLQAGESFVRQGDPPAWMFIFLEGAFQWRGEFGGDTVVMPANGRGDQRRLSLFQNEEVHGGWASPERRPPAPISRVALPRAGTEDAGTDH
jgi:hypothetical protein